LDPASPVSVLMWLYLMLAAVACAGAAVLDLRRRTGVYRHAGHGSLVPAASLPLPFPARHRPGQEV
jgi:hypothetical protein